MTLIIYTLGHKQFSVYIHDSTIIGSDSTIIGYRIDVTNFCEDDICAECIKIMIETDLQNYDAPHKEGEPFIAYSNCTCSDDDVRFGYRLMIVSIRNKDVKPDVKPQDSIYTIHYSSSKSIKNSDFMQQLASLTFSNIEVFNVQKTMDSYDDVTCATIHKYNDGFKTKKEPIVQLGVCDDSKKNSQFMAHFQSIIESILTQKSKPNTKKNHHVGPKKKEK